MDPNRTLYDHGEDGPPEANAYKRAVYRIPPTHFSVEVLTPCRQGNHFCYGMRIKSEADARSLISTKSSGSSVSSVADYEVWRRWEDCLRFQETLEREYAMMARQERARLRGRLEGQKSEGVRNGLYLKAEDQFSPVQRAASFASLPMGPDPQLIATDLHNYLPKLAKKGTFFRPSTSTVEQRGREFEALINALLRDDDDVPMLIIELRRLRVIRDFFGYWRRDHDREMKEKNRKEENRKEENRRSQFLSPPVSTGSSRVPSHGTGKTSAIFGSSAFGMYFSSSNLSLQLPTSSMSITEESGFGEANKSDTDLDARTGGSDLKTGSKSRRNSGPQNETISSTLADAVLPVSVQDSEASTSRRVDPVVIHVPHQDSSQLVLELPSISEFFDKSEYPQPMVLSPDVEIQEIPFGEPELEEATLEENQTPIVKMRDHLHRSGENFLEHDVRRLTIHEEDVDGEEIKPIQRQLHDTLHLEISSSGSSSRSSRGTSLGSSSISMSTTGTSLHQFESQSLSSSPLNSPREEKNVSFVNGVHAESSATIDPTGPRVTSTISNLTASPIISRRRTLSSGARHRARMSDILPYDSIMTSEFIGTERLPSTPKRESITSIPSLSTPTTPDSDTVAIKAILRSSTIVAFRSSRNITLQELRRKLREKFVDQQGVPLSHAYSIGYQPLRLNNATDQSKYVNGRTRSSSLSSVGLSDRVHLRYVTSQVQWRDVISSCGTKLSLHIFDYAD